MSSVVTNSLIANTVTTNSLMTNSLSGNAIMVSGSVAGVSFVGNGAGLSYLNLANVYGTLAVGSGGTGVTTSTGTGNLVLNVSPTFQGTVTMTGNLVAANLAGNADGISSVPAANLAGTIANARLPPVISVANVTANGAGLSSLNLANVYGTLAVGSGGTGVTTGTGSGNLVFSGSPTFQGNSWFDGNAGVGGTMSVYGSMNGNANGISSVPAGNLAGTIANARLPSVISVANVAANGAGLSSLNLANVYGTLAVGSGGSGVTTSTGSGNLVLNVSPTFQGTVTLAGTSTLQQITEVLTAKTGATGVVTHDFTTGTLFYHSSIAANFTCNLTNVPTTDSRTVAVTLILNQGATPYMCTAFQIDGVAQTLKWQGGSAASGTASKTDFVTFSLVRTGAAWQVFAQNVNFG